MTGSLGGSPFLLSVYDGGVGRVPVRAAVFTGWG